MRKTCASIRPQRLRRRHHHQPQDRRHLPAGRRPPPLRRVVRPRQRRFHADYWKTIWHWYEHGGDRDRRRLSCASLDLSAFNPKAPPPKTEAFWEIVNAAARPRMPNWPTHSSLGNPNAVTMAKISGGSRPAVADDFVRTARTAARIPHRFEECGYVPVRNPDAKDGLWKIDGNARSSTPS